MATKRIGRPQARAIADLIEKAANEALKSEGLTVTIKGGIRFSAGEVTVKLEASLPEIKSDTNEQECRLLGFSENIVGKKFLVRTTWHTITEINLNRRKYPISTETQRGGRYKWPVDVVRRNLQLAGLSAGPLA
jgi:hypothetical protein